RRRRPPAGLSLSTRSGGAVRRDAGGVHLRWESVTAVVSGARRGRAVGVAAALLGHAVRRPGSFTIGVRDVVGPLSRSVLCELLRIEVDERKVAASGARGLRRSGCRGHADGALSRRPDATPAQSPRLLERRNAGHAARRRTLAGRRRWWREPRSREDAAV